jgi:hypothetical protein
MFVSFDIAASVRSALSHTASTLHNLHVESQQAPGSRGPTVAITDMVDDVVSNRNSLSGSLRVATPHQLPQSCCKAMDLGAALGAIGSSRYELSLGKLQWQ